MIFSKELLKTKLFDIYLKNGKYKLFLLLLVMQNYFKITNAIRSNSILFLIIFFCGKIKVLKTSILKTTWKSTCIIGKI